MKYYLTIISLSWATLHSAQKPTDEKPSHQDRLEIENQLKNPNLQKLDIAQYYQHLTNEDIATEAADTCIRLNEPIPTDILQFLNPENVIIAHQYNQNLQQQLSQKKEPI